MKCLGRGMVLFFESSDIDFVNHVLRKTKTYTRRFHTGQWERLTGEEWRMLSKEESKEYEDKYQIMLKDAGFEKDKDECKGQEATS